MPRQTAGMWETEVHLAQGGLWMEELVPLMPRPLVELKLPPLLLKPLLPKP